MQNVSVSEVNDKYILVLKEDENNLLSVQHHEIECSDDIVKEIRKAVENPRKTLGDLYLLVSSYINESTNYNFCFPFEYNSSFIGPALSPQAISYYSYDNIIKKKREEIEKHLYGHFDTEGKQKHIEYKLSSFEKQFVLQEHKKKVDYAEIAIRYIKCNRLEKLLLEVKNDETIKMFSSDNIGWTTFDYSITDDISIKIKTNFVYGSSAYFYMAVKYKDLVLIPYSDLVHYYYANMKNLISYTQSFTCQRNSWFFALNYAADFANKSKISSELFIRNYVVEHITKMILGLRKTMNHPEEVLDNIKSVQPDYISMKVIRPFMKEDQATYEMMPFESVSVFKAEKITGALMFFDSLKKIKSLCPEVDPIMEEVLEMNKGIKSEIETVLYSIIQDLKPLEEKQDVNLKKIEILNKKIEYHENNIILNQNRRPNLDPESIKERYIRNHPFYAELINKKKILQEEMYEISKVIRRRKNLKTRMEICIERIKRQERT